MLKYTSSSLVAVYIHLRWLAAMEHSQSIPHSPIKQKIRQTKTPLKPRNLDLLPQMKKTAGIAKLKTSEVSIFTFNSNTNLRVAPLKSTYYVLPV